MANDFCTLFDVNYLPRALVLHRSLCETADEFTLRAYCMDAKSEEILRRLDLRNVVPVGLAELERDDRGLLEVKPTRTTVEYYWTATPAICLHSLDREPGLDAITYLDADLRFFSDPQQLFDEIGDASVTIVPHRYVPEMKPWEETSGVYNVEWLTFRRDEQGLETLRWWRERCLEWCYFRYEDGKMGDQKYLDDWPERFRGVHVLEHVGGGLAPWNLGNYRLGVRDGRIYVDGVPLVFFHHHSLRLFAGPAALARYDLFPERLHVTNGARTLVWGHNYAVGQDERELVWDPYLRLLGEAVEQIRAVEPGFSAGFTRLEPLALTELARRAKRMTWRTARSARRRLAR
jgi:hypothetical protein